MSRARPVTLPDGQKLWFDVHRHSELASDEQLELLAVIERADLDDLLDSVITRGEVLTRLRKALGQDGIPIDVLERRAQWREHRRLQPECLKCHKKGDSTRHHFVNKWILKELADYGQKWADRSKNCFPLCIECHRHIHMRNDEAKSIVEFLDDEQRDFAEAALTALSEERPKLLVLIARGDPGVYETRLVRDWIEGKFSQPRSQVRYLRAV